jgi:hypothetical protein
MTVSSVEFLRSLSTGALTSKPAAAALLSRPLRSLLQRRTEWTGRPLKTKAQGTENKGWCSDPKGAGLAAKFGIVTLASA